MKRQPFAEAAQDSIFIINRAGRFEYVNRFAARQLNRKPEDIIGTVHHTVFPPTVVEKQEKSIKRVFDSGKPFYAEGEVVLARGPVWLGTWLVPMKDDAGATRAVMGISRDMTALKRSEVKFRNLQLEYQTILDSVPAMIWYKDTKNNILHVNRAAAAAFGKSKNKIEGKNCRELFPDEAEEYHRDDMEVIMSGKPKLGIVEQMQIASGEKRWVQTDKVPYRDEKGDIVGVVLFVLDITERKRMEEHFLESHKMEAIGRLAGGIAHEFNNVLSGVMGSAYMIKKDLGAAHPSHADVDEIIALSKRAASVVSQLLAFGQRWQSPKAILNLNDLIERNKKMLADMIGESAQLDIKLAPGLPSVLANADNMEQALLNLCLNSRDAMQGVGRLSIATRSIAMRTSLVGDHSALPPGPYVLLEVADSGPGISPKDLPRIFEPFFSTKGPDKSRGLGLSIVYAIMKEHGGTVTVQCEPKTTFRLFLPVCVKEPSSDTVEDKAQGAQRGRQTILVADDEAVIRKMLVRILQPHNYALLVAKDGREAVEIFRANQDKVALVFLDVVMPEVDGIQACERIRTLRPDAKIVLMSGYATAVSEKAVRDHYGAFIAKPFTPEEILGKIREVLNA